jgi:hypothetical protein
MVYVGFNDSNRFVESSEPALFLVGAELLDPTVLTLCSFQEFSNVEPYPARWRPFRYPR